MRLSRSFIIAWLALLSVFIPASMTHAQTPNLRFSDLGYGTLTLEGMYGATTVFLPFQSGWEVDEDAQIAVEYAASPLLNEERSSLTVFANDLQVASIRPVADGSRQRFSFTVPADRLGDAGLTLRFQAYLRLTDNQCEETNNPGQWLAIYPESRVRLDPSIDTTAPTLAMLPTALMEQNAPDDPPALTVVLPEAPSSTELTTALRLLAQLGGSVGELPEINVAFGAPTETQGENDHLVFIGQPDALALADIEELELPAPLADESFRTADGESMPAEHAAFQILNSPYNEERHLLLISSPTDTGLQLAGDAVQHRPTYNTLNDAFEFVRGLSETDFAPLLPAWSDERTSFAQFDNRTRRIEGIGSFTEEYVFPLPPGRAVQAGGTLTLNYAFSPVLRSSESYIAAFINDVYVGTAITGQGIDETTATFSLPAAELNQNIIGERSQTWTLRLDVANYLVEENCEQTHADTAWTEIYPTSHVDAGFNFLPLPDLQIYPYPFVASDGDVPTAIVIPDEPTTDEISAVLAIAARMGQRAFGDFDLALITESDATEAAYSDHNLILTGTLERLPLIETLQAEMNTIPEQQVYQALNNPEYGILRESQSPWNPERVALLVYGQDADTLERAQMLLQERIPPVNQPGAVAIVPPDGEPRVIYRAAEPLPQSDASIVREPRVSPPEPWLGVTIILGIGALLVLGVLGWAYRRANN